MDERTARALCAINGAFYRDRAGEFAAARSDPWPGWDQLLPLLGHLPADALRVLDVGCGHGRFAAYLADRGLRGSYVGLDASEPLLAEARRRPLPGFRRELRHHDVVADPPGPPLAGRRFDLIALFGVLHHLPGLGRRQRLLRDLAERLAPGGLLALTAWQFAAFARFQARVLPWEDYNRSAGQAIDTRQLEPGDHLLRWGAEDETVRYCHFADAAELEALLGELSLARVAAYAADGREGDLNRYYVLRAEP